MFGEGGSQRTDRGSSTLKSMIAVVSKIFCVGNLDVMFLES